MKKRPGLGCQRNGQGSPPEKTHTIHQVASLAFSTLIQWIVFSSL